MFFAIELHNSEYTSHDIRKASSSVQLARGRKIILRDEDISNGANAQNRQLASRTVNASSGAAVINRSQAGVIA